MTKGGNRITLSAVDQKIIRFIAHEREDNNERAYGGTNTKRVDDRDGYAIQCEGFAGEFAFCRLFNIFPDFTTHPRSAELGEDRGDAVMHDGRTVDIKTSRFPQAKLLVSEWIKPTVDLYALMTGTFPVYEFRGFIESHELLKPERVEDLGRGPAYAAQQDELRELY